MKRVLLFLITAFTAINAAAQSAQQLYKRYYSLYIQKKYTEAIIPLTKAAEKGYAKAQNALGVMYFKALGVEKNETTAWKWCEKAAKKGYTQAYQNLCDFYMHRTSTDAELLKIMSTKWCKKAIDAELEVDPDAYGILGIRDKASTRKSRKNK